MLRIRPEQQAVFQNLADIAFERRVVAFMRDKCGPVKVQIPSGSFSVRDLPEQTLSQMVHTGVARARTYGMSWESSLTSFVMIMFICAPNFDAHPLVGRILHDPETEPDKRIDKVIEAMTEESWKTASQMYDVHTWALEQGE